MVSEVVKITKLTEKGVKKLQDDNNKRKRSGNWNQTAR